MSYDMIDHFLRNNLGDDDYAEYSAALDSLCTAQPKQEQGEPVAWNEDQAYAWGRGCYEIAQGATTEWKLFGQLTPKEQAYWVAKAAFEQATPQQRKPLMLEKFREMEELLDDNPHQHKKMFTDDELKIIMETTMPVIDWKARYGVELNNGERNKWMLEWFIAFARAIEAAHGIKE